MILFKRKNNNKYREPLFSLSISLDSEYSCCKLMSRFRKYFKSTQWLKEAKHYIKIYKYKRTLSEYEIVVVFYKAVSELLNLKIFSGTSSKGGFVMHIIRNNKNFDKELNEGPHIEINSGVVNVTSCLSSL